MHLKMITIKFLIFAFLPASLISCTQMGAFFKSTDHFSNLDSDNRIRYETGALDIALQAADKLDNAIEIIEKEHGYSFVDPVVVYVCANEESFAEHTGLNKKIKAAVFNKKIFLSSNLREQPQRIPTLTIHELSHLHIVQRIGTAKYLRNIPSWFREGWAVHVSNGGGAEYVSEIEAAQAILDGSCFYPDSAGSLLFPKTASSYHLKPHMFYRQSAMFVRFLQNVNPDGFKLLLKAIQNNSTFEDAVYPSYEKHIDKLWFLFQEELKSLFPLKDQCH